MPPIVYSADAIADLAAIAHHLSTEVGLGVAAALLDRMRHRIGALASFPAYYPLVSEAGVDIRRTVVARYLVLYRMEISAIVVVRVLHTSRDVSAALMGRGDTSQPS
jgi:plasmid stabilization system protein ParE